MSQEEPISQALAGVTKPLVEAFIDRGLGPILRNLREQRRVDKALLSASEVLFQEYLGRSYEQFAYLRSVALQSRKRRLADLYVPLTLCSPDSNSSDKHRIDGYVDALLRESTATLIRDAAGMGKSTLIKYMHNSCIEAGTRVPVLVELRRLSEQRRLIPHILALLGTASEAMSEKVFRALYDRGDFVFFLDGYDEILPEAKQQVSEDMADLMVRGTKNAFVVTSRPEESLLQFSNLEIFTIRPLQLEEAYALIRKCDESGEKAEPLIETLRRSTELQALSEFMTNPMLVALLFRAYDYKQTVPLKKHLFYRQVYDSLYDMHDLTKSPGYVRPKQSALDGDTFHQVLRRVGFRSVVRGKLEYGKDDLVSEIGEVLRQLPGATCKASDIFSDLIVSVPLFVSDGAFYRWSHKSIQEYFAAQFIAVDSKAHQREIIRRMVEHDNPERFINVLDLLYDIDPAAWRVAILKPLMDRVVEHLDKYRAIKWPGIDEKWLRIRAAVTLGRTCALAKADGRPADLGVRLTAELTRGTKSRVGWMINTLRQVHVDASFYAIEWETIDAVLLRMALRRELPIFESIKLEEVAGPPSRADWVLASQKLKEVVGESAVLSDTSEAPVNAPGLFEEATRWFIGARSTRAFGHIISSKACTEFREELRKEEEGALVGDPLIQEL